MGGGTTIVEAVRMGFRAIGIELNPVPWFIVKMALAPASINDLNDAFTRLKERTVPWSRRSLHETLSRLYQTDAPFYWNDGAEAIDVRQLIYFTHTGLNQPFALIRHARNWYRSLPTTSSQRRLRAFASIPIAPALRAERNSIGKSNLPHSSPIRD